MADLCKHCNRPASEHHEFVPPPLKPDGCACDLAQWIGGSIGPICDNLLCGPSLSYCARCGHDKACHAPKD